MKNIFIAVAIVAILSACEPFLETDISGQQVVVIAPANGVEIADGQVVFRWSALDGAEKYRVTVVSPSFAQARVAVRDTVLYRDSLPAMSFGFYITLASADYEWSIQAFNEAYSSVRSVYGLKVIEIPETPKPEESEVTDPYVTEQEKKS